MLPLRLLDGQEVTFKEKVKADILFGEDLEEKKKIFKEFLPEEDFVDRRLFVEEQIDPESDSDEDNENIENLELKGMKSSGDKLMNSQNKTLSSIYDRRTMYGFIYF